MSVREPARVGAEVGCGCLVLLLAGAIAAIWIGLAVLVWRVALSGLLQ